MHNFDKMFCPSGLCSIRFRLLERVGLFHSLNFGDRHANGANR